MGDEPCPKPNNFYVLYFTLTVTNNGNGDGIIFNGDLISRGSFIGGVSTACNLAIGYTYMGVHNTCTRVVGLQN